MFISPLNIDFGNEITLPLSKSESNRALMIAFYSEIQKNKNSKTQNETNIETWCLGDLVTSLSTSDDTVLLKNLLNKINRYVKNCEQSLLTLDCHNAGTVFRFLMTAAAIQFTIHNSQFTILLTGSDRMKQRPIDSLVDALRSIGISIEYTEKEGFPPILIKSPTIETPTDGTDLHRFCVFPKNMSDVSRNTLESPTDDTDLHGCYSSETDTRDLRRLEISVEQTSQFASSLLLAAPLWKNGLELYLTGNLSSLPYIDMTINMMKYCGIDVERNERIVKVNSGKYNCDAIKIEPDWSAAAFWYEIVALSDKSEVLLKNLNINSLQADAVAMKMFQALGVETIAVKKGIVIRKAKGKSLKSTAKVQQPKFNSQSSTFNFQLSTFNFQHCPDLFPAVIATCAGLGIDAEFSGLKNLSIKESDRKKAMMNELKKINVSFEEISDDELKMFCPDELPCFTEENPIIFNNYDDHRIAMALSILSMKIGAISMENTEVVSKSYPRFFEEFTIKFQNLKT